MSRKSVATVVRAAVLGMAAVAVWGLTPGCGGPSIGAYCDKVCDCMGCSKSQRDDCADSIEDAKSAAGKDGCGDQFNDYFSCVNEELECNNDQISADGCESEAEALGKCSAGSGFGKTACEKLADQVIGRYKACGVEIPQSGGGDTECSDAQENQAKCLMPCIGLIPCVCIDPDLAEQCTSDQAAPYVECVTSCQ